ncbi:class I SAM-dependent methyltransferase [Acinetobacter sp. B51(2017)]|uniref:class I SAM-dependent methyltransferase n=1 Tax=Acinetobacter sp. B51(2017) TaxID=2060938 RepID=UPI000F08CF0C|nr:class I SAM-dependent methyltransferase [Acinetobacter sp. B51(2017)]
MTTNWTDGYHTDVNYTYGYYRDLSPNFQKFCLLLNGIECSDSLTDHHHCELGFGQGVSINIHAASNLAHFYGTDFNPAHAAHANLMAEQSGALHHFYDASFEELLNTDLPQFDSISLHGIWSWISHSNQTVLLKFIRKFLKPQGIVYISYNCLTGWAANMPIRELLHSHFNFNSTSIQPIQKVQQALAFSQSLIEQQPKFSQSNPHALDKIQDLQQQDPNYLIHEYLNQDWQCFSFQQIVRTLEEIKLSFAGSTNLDVHLDDIHLSQQHQAFLKQIEHPVFKEQCRDYFLNTQFRKDLFIRGKNILPALQVQQRLRQTRFVLLCAAEALPTTITGHLGEFNLLQQIYKPLAEHFKCIQYKSQSLFELEHALPHLNYAQLLNALVILCHLNLAQPCQKKVSSSTLATSQALNRYILEQASYHQNYQVLANPMTGIGLPISQIEALFYRAHFVEQLQSSAQLAEYAQQHFDHLSWHLLDAEKQPLLERSASLNYLTQQAEQFIQQAKLLIAKQLSLFG